MNKFGLTHISLLALLLFGGCAADPVKNAQTLRVDNEHQAAGTLWFQRSAEAKALFYQGYNVATDLLKRDKKESRSSERPQKRGAVILDLDETVLDNSPYQAKSILEGWAYPTGWREWVDMAKAEILPGAAEFLRFADANGYEILYISNRKVAEKDATYKNLVNKGLPVKPENLLLRADRSSKEPRREHVLLKYRVVMLLGDNLDDFTDQFEDKNIEERIFTTERLREEFGRKFITFPNPMYGTWLGALYDYNWSLSQKEQAEKRRNLLQAY